MNSRTFRKIRRLPIFAAAVLLIVFAPGPEVRTRIRTVERIKIVPSKVTGSMVAPHTRVKAASAAAAAVREPQSV